MDDAQLLQQYADEGSEAAFQTLVRRHLGLVHGAALRQVGDPSLAQDVAQAVFLLLAKKAGRLGRGVVVSGWLYRTTGFVASRVRRSEQRRRRREQEALDMSQLQSTDEVWKRLAPELDEALSRLGDTDRNVILLRFGSGRSHREVGEVLGLSEEAVRKRAHRTLGVLRELLMRSGVTVSVGMLSTLLVERICAQPPPGLETGILAGVRDGVAPSVRVGDIARDTVAAWRSVWIPWAAVVGIAVLILLGVLMRSSQSVRSEPGGNAPSVAATTPGLPGKAAPFGAAAAAPGAVFRLKVTSAVDGTPLRGVPVVARMVVGRDWTSRDDLVTAADGVCEIPVPPNGLARLDAGAHAPGWGGRFFTWLNKWQEPLPEGYVLALQPGLSFGGEVRNQRREPVPGVQVWINYAISDTSWREPLEDRERSGLPVRARVATTGRDGRWSCSVIPGDFAHVRFEFEHPEFAPAARGIGRGPEADLGRLERFRAGTEVTVLEPGHIVFGRVVDTEGNPVAGVRIAPSWNEPGVVSAADGGFTLFRFPRGSIALVATADGFAPREFKAEAGGPAALVRLEPGLRVAARVVDPKGDPISGATLAYDGGYGLGTVGWDARTDPEGRVAWNGAPRGVPLRFFASAEGYALVQGIPLAADGVEHAVTLYPIPIVRGRVVDALTGDVVDRFKAVPGSRPGDFLRADLRYGRAGDYALPFPEGLAAAVLIEADGYDAAVGVPRPDASGGLRCDFELRPATVSGFVRGVVRNPDGSPAAAAEVFLITLERGVSILEGGALKAEPEGPVFRTDSAGRFEIPWNSRAHSIVASGADGFVRNRVRPGEDPLVLTLQPWGRIEARPGPRLGDYVLNELSGAGQHSGISIYWRVTPASDGFLEVERVPAGTYELRENQGLGRAILFRVRAGETTVVRPDPGRTVVGRIQSGPWPDLVKAGLDGIQARLGSETSPGRFRTSASVGTVEEWHRLSEAWESEKVQNGLSALNVLPVSVSSEGSFRSEGVPSGRYVLTVEWNGDSSGAPPNVRRWSAPVEIPHVGGSEVPVLDVGALTLVDSAEVIRKSP